MNHSGAWGGAAEHASTGTAIFRHMILCPHLSAMMHARAAAPRRPVCGHPRGLVKAVNRPYVRDGAGAEGRHP